jgi:phosphate transport system protein
VSELRLGFHRNLDEIDARVGQMFALVTEAVGAATECLLTDDREAAQQIVERDEAIDELTHTVDAAAERALSLQTPMGTDLRYLLSIVRMVPELERSGDLAEHIAARVASGRIVELTPKLRRLVEDMGHVAVGMWRDATSAFIDRDPTAYDRLDAADDELDSLHDQLTSELVSGTVSAPLALEMALIGRFYERLGDHAFHVSDRIKFLAMGPQALPE